MQEKKSNVVLIGMAGAGKSTIGVLAAKALGMDFLDTDLLIQQQTGKLLQETIDEDGIDAFLAVEQVVLCGVDVKNTVVATGGKLEQTIISCCEHKILFDEDLVLHGLWLIWQKNLPGKNGKKR